MKNNEMLYLDYQATTPVDPRVLEAMAPYSSELFGNPHSSDHCAGWEASRAIEEAAADVAGLIGADPDEVIFTSGATEANNLALLGLARRGATGRRKRILISKIEHKSILTVARILQEQLGYIVELLPVNNCGELAPSALDEALSDDVLLVSIMAVNNEIGTIQNITKFSEIIKIHGDVIFHCDAAQAPCAMELTTMACLVDLISLSGHKMYGPKGIGALYVRRDLQDMVEPIIYGGEQQNGLRAGTIPTPLCVGLGSAARLLAGNAGRMERDALHKLNVHFTKELAKLPWPNQVNGPLDIRRHPGNMNVCFKGFSAIEILGALQPKLAASTGAACTSGISEPSHVLSAIGLNKEDLDASIRFSFGRFTTKKCIDKAISLLREALARSNR